MKNIKINLLTFILLLVVVAVSGCSNSSYPPRPHYGSAYGYGYARLPRVIGVRPAPRVVYRTPQPRYRYNAPANARQSHAPRGNEARSNRNYQGNSSRSRSYGPR